MIHDQVERGHDNYNSNFLVIHFQLRLGENTSCSIGFIVTNWNKSCNIYCKLKKGFISAGHICSKSKRVKLFSKGAGAGVFKIRYGLFDCFHC